jgi:hypothetical protein
VPIARVGWLANANGRATSLRVALRRTRAQAHDPFAATLQKLKGRLSTALGEIETRPSECHFRFLIYPIARGDSRGRDRLS